MQDIVTYNLSDMMADVQLSELIELLEALKDQGYPANACSSDGLKIGFNHNSGNMWIESDDYDCAMLNNEGELELWLYSPYSGHEGFLSELIERAPNENWHREDLEWLMERMEEIDHEEEEVEAMKSLLPNARED